MSIASAIATKQQQVADSYTAVSNKGGTLPATQNLTNLATAIDSISSGSSSPVIISLNVTPTTSAQTITAPSGTDGYSPITVNAVTSSIDSNITANNIKKDVTILDVTGTYEGSGGGSFIGIPREVKNGVYQMPTENFTFSLPNDATDVSWYALYYAFYNSGLTSVDLSSLTTVTGGYALSSAFRECTALTSVDLSSLTTISGMNSFSSIFQSSTGLTSVDLSSLTTVTGSYALSGAFRSCTALTSVDLSSLTTVTGSYALSNAFYGCTALTSIYFRALTTKSFGSISKNQFNNMMQNTGTSKTHTIHFPSNMQSTISGLTGYPLFGGTSGYVVCAFDLPATS